MRKLLLKLSTGKGPLLFVRSLAWRLDLPLVAEQLAEGSEDGIERYYSSRMTDCSFLTNPDHYEHPRIEWILNIVRGGALLEVGCGNGGLTQLLSVRVDHVVALDVSRPSIEALIALRLPNVEARADLVERFVPGCAFDWIVLAEVVEHLRNPLQVLQRCLGWLKPTGKILLTTPNGRWGSIEHLHEFEMKNWCGLLAETGARNIHAFVINDYHNKQRWLGGILSVETFTSTSIL